MEENSLETFLIEAEASIYGFLPIYESIFPNNEEGTSQYIDLISEVFPNFTSSPKNSLKNQQEVNHQLIHYVQVVLPERIKTIVENILLVKLSAVGLTYEDTQSGFWQRLDQYCYKKFKSSCFSNPVGWCQVKNVLQTMIEYHQMSFYLNNNSLKDMEDKLEYMYLALWEISHITGNKPFVLFCSLIKHFLEDLKNNEQYAKTAFQEKINQWLQEKNPSPPF